MKKVLKLTVLFFVFTIFSTINSYSQCFNIESILVDACEGTSDAEGQNEMVRFKVGNSDINTTQMRVTWPSNSWGGLIQNSVTAQKVNLINQEILAAGGCGVVLEPTNGVLPANASVILVTSHLFDVALNPFGAMNETVYILFQNSVETSGHFGNFGTSATRTLTISFGNGCSDTVSYNRAFLVDTNGQQAAGNGAMVNYTPDGIPTYLNNGCGAPVQTSVFEITSIVPSVCIGETIQLTSEIVGFENIQWSSSNGIFGTPNSPNTNFTITTAISNFVSVTLSATNACGETTSQIINIALATQLVPIFDDFSFSYCSSDQFPSLPRISSNGVEGTWFPSIISENYMGDYVFTPISGQCAISISKKIEIYSLDFNFAEQCEDEDYVVRVFGNKTDIEYIWKDASGRVLDTGSNSFNVSKYLKGLIGFSFPFKIVVEANFRDCSLTKEIEITSINCSIQRGISPNGDLKNDFFDLRSLSVLNLTIYNRYGSEVFQKALYKDEWFGQNKNGSMLPSGTYFYAIQTADNKTITGWIQLIY